MKEAKDVLTEILTNEGLNGVQAAEKIGICKQALSSYKTGNKKLSDKYLKHIAKKLGYRVNKSYSLHKLNKF